MILMKVNHDLCHSCPHPQNYPQKMNGIEMKTYQIFKNVSYEYFVEAESLEEAQNKIIRYKPQPESEELIEWVFCDAHDSGDWTYEPVNQ